MGIRCHVHELPVSEFELLIKGVDVNLTTGDDCHLEKSWIAIYSALQEMGYPLNLAIIGDNLIPQYPTEFDLLGDNAQGSEFVGLASPALVREVAKAFATLPQSAAVKLDKWDSGYFEALKELYYHVAKRVDV